MERIRLAATSLPIYCLIFASSRLCVKFFFCSNNQREGGSQRVADAPHRLCPAALPLIRTLPAWGRRLKRRMGLEDAKSLAARRAVTVAQFGRMAKLW